MDDIEVIYELEKLLGVESENISLPKSKNQGYLKNKIRYLIVDNKINRVTLNAPNLKKYLEEVFGLLSKLNSLTELNVPRNELKYIPESITNLISLTSLDLSGNRLAEIPNTITNLTFLKDLDLSGNKFKEFPEAITNVTSLETLNLAANQCKAVSESITKLNSLVRLELEVNQISNNTLPLKQIVKLPNLKDLSLFENPLSIPKEILGGMYNNCLQDLKNYLNDGDKFGWAANNELKIILIGNGGTGKTSLVNRLVKNIFIEEYKSTHGIQLIQYKDLQPYPINIWDFAGQDIYHATHRLFMQTRALFLILWDNETENQEYSTVNEDGKKRDYKNYKLDYWLNYVKVLGKGSRALVIQSKETKARKKNPPQELMNAYKDIWIDNLSIDSAIDDPDLNGFENLKTAIKKTIKVTNLLGKEQLPNNWVVSRDKFHKLLDKRIKTISYDDFTIMCEGKESVNTDTLLNWLVDSGVVFYKDGLFNNQIIIDQQWAINAVYKLFDREKFYYDALQKRNGYFDKGTLKKIWAENNEEEIELFLSYMKSCEICYKKDNGYIAPALLPDKSPKILNSFWQGKESHFIKYEMLFFQYGTMQSFLVRLGNMQLNALIEVELWQYGILFKYNENTYALVEAKPNEKQIIVRVSGQNTKSLVDKIRNLIEEIQGKEGISESFSRDGNIFFDESDKEKYSEMKKVFEKDEDDKFENEGKSVLHEIKEIMKRIDKTTQATHTDLKSLIVTFSNNILEIKQSLSFRQEDDEARIIQLSKVIDNHRLLLEKDKNQRLADAKEKAKNAFSKFSSLQTDSQTFIAMGFYFLEILPDNGDFSPAALQFCRALELEMKVVFINFKNSQFKTLTSYPNQNNFTYTKFQGFINEPKGLTLGEMVNILNNIHTLKHHQLFIDFEKFMNHLNAKAFLNQFLVEVEIFKDAQKSPRNKSAHTSPLSKFEAEDCKILILRALGYWIT